MDLSDKRLLLIGCGNMGRALALGWRALKFARLSVYDVHSPTAAALAQDARAALVSSLAAELGSADIVLLAIKPQVLPSFLKDSAALFKPGQTLISILAGTPLKRFQEGIPAPVSLVRAMPNTPALVSHGMTALCGQNPQSLETARTLFDCVGKVLVVDESFMDAVTAVSGSGPAYVFYFLESLLQAAQAQGFSEADSKTLVFQTVQGALKLLENSGESPESLRIKVTSPGGTTQAALETLKRLGFAGAVTEGVAAAARRSKELGQ